VIDARISPSHTAEVRSDSRLLRLVPSLYQVTLVAILGAILVVALAPRLDTDFWWHLKDGQYIVLHHVVPARDFMSYTLVGHSWTDHEWLAEVWLYGLYRLAGLWGPIAFFALVICATFFLVYRQMMARGLNRVLSLFLVAAAFMASSASWGPRIQMLTLFFLAAYMLILHRFGETRDRRWLLALPGLMLIWANVHGGFALGLVVIVVTLAGEWLNRATRHAGSWNSADLKALLYALLGTAAVTMVNPNGFRQLLYPLTFVLPNAYTNLIEESASPNFHMPVMMLFEILLLVLVTAFFIGRPRLNWTHLFLVLAFTHLALSQVRNVAVWAVVITPLVAVYIQAALPALRGQFPRLNYQSRPVNGRLGPLVNLVLLALIVVAYVLESTHFVNAQTLRSAETDQYPKAAIAYMRSHDLPAHVFASYSWGGYLLWNLFPRYRDYMDSRADTLFNNAILRDYLTIYAGKPGWESVLRHRSVDVVLVERTAPLAQLLAIDPAWKRDFQDAISALYVRRSPLASR
jgi:hypothetical protein